jgi:hypothetical protein
MSSPAAPPATPPPSYPALWYTSNTPISVGQRDCAFARWLGYHAGPHGTGYRRRATAVPLATGSGVHDGVQLIGEWILEWQAKFPRRRLTALPDAVAAWAATEAAGRYEAKARAKGLLLTGGDDDAAAVAQLVAEQRTLVEGLIWIYVLVRLPAMLASYRLLAVEHEEAPVLDCTCGLGDWIGHATDHAARGCRGVVVQGRTDALWAPLDGDTQSPVVYEEIKTKATERKSWDDAWEHSGQLFLNMEAASRRLGRDVSQAFVTVLYKGWRGRDRGAPPTDPRYQHSPLCYGWHDPGNLPLREAEWSSRYRWKTADGETRQLGKTFRRVPIWVPDAPLPVAREGASRIENWVRQYITPDQVVDLCKTLGPFPRPRARVAKATAALLTEEQFWRVRVEALRRQGIVTPDDRRVEAVIPRSWACTNFDGTPCQFRPVCDEAPGWERIGEMGIYEIRRPHHATERVAFEQLGVTFPDEGDEDWDGEEGGE